VGIREIKIRYGESRLQVKIPEKNFLYSIAPKGITSLPDEKKSLKEALGVPIGSTCLSGQLKPGMKVVIAVDDMTRPTPQKRILPVLLDELDSAGIKDKDITVIIALGTHRYMDKLEMVEHLGSKVVERVEVVNHEWKDNNNFINMGSTEKSTPVIVNKRVVETDYIIGVGSIVPHDQAGWSGGSKIIQPGVSSWKTTGDTHMLATKEDYLGIPGRKNCLVREEIEKVVKIVGLDFIVNVVVDKDENMVKILAGDPVLAQREGIKYSREVYVRKIPQIADIVIVSSYPGDIDYWQGIKSLLFSQRGVERNGTVIFVSPLTEGITPTHPEMEKYCDKNYGEIMKLTEEGVIKDKVCAAALIMHALIMQKVKVICVSEGLSLKQKRKLGFLHAENVEEAIEIGMQDQGKKAKIGIIDYGSHVLPEVK